MDTYILRNDQQTGPYSEQQIRAGLGDGTFSADEYGWREGMPEWVSLRSLFPPLVAALPPAQPMMTAPIVYMQQHRPANSCPTCGQGSLMRKKIHRMSGPTVVIGYILLIPCLLGMLEQFKIFRNHFVSRGSGARLQPTAQAVGRGAGPRA